MAKIKRSDFARQHKHHSVAVNIRLKKDGDAAKPTRAEVIGVLEEIMETGSVPDGWKFAMINWRRPNWRTDYFRTGTIKDLMGSLAQVLPFMIDKARVGLDRQKPKWEVEIGMKY